jgi:two-component system alkaline phosphatase synthesis response regulator PhoP
MNNKILITDDEPALLAILVDEFTQEGFEVMTAKNGEEGLNSSLKNRPDIILLDIIMPVMDGITMLHKLREDNWGKNVKVILLTNLSDSEKITKDISLLSDGYIVKSDWKIKDIVQEVYKKLEKNYS